METSMGHKRYLQGRAVQSKMKEEMTRLKQENQSHKLQYEQVHTDLRRKLQAREQDISELQGKLAKKDKQLDQFRHLHSTATMNRMGEANRKNHNDNVVPPSSSHSRQRGEPPLRAIMKQKEAKEQQQMQLLQQGASSSHRIGSSVAASSSQGHGHSRHHNPPVLMQRQRQQQQQQYQQQNMRRPFSGASASSGSGLPSTPRIRDLSSASEYAFTATTMNSGGHSVNKRLRMSTPTGMSPNTAFAHNINAHQPWSAGSGTSFNRRR